MWEEWSCTCFHNAWYLNPHTFFLLFALISRIPHHGKLLIWTFLDQLSHDLLLWVGVCRRLSCVNIFFSRTTGPVCLDFTNSSSWKTLAMDIFRSPESLRQIKYIVMMTKEGYTKIVNFMTPYVKVWSYKSL